LRAFVVAVVDVLVKVFMRISDSIADDFDRRISLMIDGREIRCLYIFPVGDQLIKVKVV
jgi:hypothetical protein